MRFGLNLLLGMVIVLASVSLVPSLHEASTPAPSIMASSSIIINELMYDPLGLEAVEEWVELYNPGTIPVNVTNWTLSDQDGDVDFVFPNITFPAGSFALVHIGQGQNSSVFLNGKADFFMWKTSGIWSTTGDDVLLANSTGSTVDFLSYAQWDGYYVDPAPADFPYVHSNASARPGFTIALVNGAWKESVPSPLENNGVDSAPAILITEVHYEAYGQNEFFRIYNTQSTNVDITRWYLDNSKGMLIFPSGTVMASHQTITVSQNPDNFALQLLEIADFEYGNIDLNVPEMSVMGTVPSLVNDGGELQLFNCFCTPIDVFAYGYSDFDGVGWDSEPCPDLSQGGVAKRYFNVTYSDTNTSSDWESPRPYFIGQSDFANTVINSAGAMTLFASPDSSFEVITGLLDSANQYIWINLYEFTNTILADHLVSAIRRGVDVHLFMEGAPVGGINKTELFILKKIVEAGGSVRLMTNDPDAGIYDRYEYTHAKYVVMDDITTIMMSENWGWSGVPPSNSTGNRGWGAAVEDAALATYFKAVFTEDFNPQRLDSVAFDSTHTQWNSGINGSYMGTVFDRIFEPLKVTSASQIIPILSPDTSLSTDTILGMLGSATERVYVEEFYIYKHWGSRSTGSPETTPNLYLEAIIEAARRGCEIRILLDSTYYNVMDSDPIDNDDTVEYVNLIAAAEGLDMEAKLINLNEHNLGKVHNKGLIADDSVLISSINWNYQSAALNRESGIIIENPEVGEYFAGIFQYDWKDDLTPPFAHFRYNDTYYVNTTVNLNASTSSDNVAITNYTWTLDGQAVLFGPDFAWNFSTIGQYMLNLSVADAWGNNDSFARAINITSAPIIIDNGDDAEDDGTLNNSDESDDALDSSFSKMVLLFLLVPIFIFGALVGVVIAKRK
ncbi:MAG: lamin tail domain-containing protein [Thermoplasmata archaeon]|nr:lamin tail domain-containing protein [Thermoplasmata archaeon]